MAGVPAIKLPIYMSNRYELSIKASNSNEIRTQNHLFRERTLNHLVKRPIWLNG